MLEQNEQHLALERLAELATEQPNTAERAHLEECALCASELEAYARLTRLAADERRVIAPPLTDWYRLRGRLLEEGLLAERPSGGVVRRFRAAARWRIAAGALLVSTGLVVGRLSAGLSFAEAVSWSRTAAQEASSGDLAATESGDFASTADALAALATAQRIYERAASYLAVHDTGTIELPAESYRARLVALDQMAEASLRVLRSVPADPVMNEMYHSTLSAREQTLLKLASTLPAGARLTRF
jgi:hypothetical protein